MGFAEWKRLEGKSGLKKRNEEDRGKGKGSWVRDHPQLTAENRFATRVGTLPDPPPQLCHAPQNFVCPGGGEHLLQRGTKAYLQF